jgi:hypothetical protein
MSNTSEHNIEGNVAPASAVPTSPTVLPSTVALSSNAFNASEHHSNSEPFEVEKESMQLDADLKEHDVAMENVGPVPDANGLNDPSNVVVQLQDQNAKLRARNKYLRNRIEQIQGNLTNIVQLDQIRLNCTTKYADDCSRQRDIFQQDNKQMQDVCI